MTLARCAATALLALAQVAAAEVVSYTRSGNRFVLKSGASVAEIEWLTPSSFRFRRAFAGKLPILPITERLTVPLQVEEPPGELLFASRHIRVGIRGSGFLVTVRKSAGGAVFADTQEPAYRNGILTLERAAPPGAGFYGLGPRAALELNARGSMVPATVPFLFSTAGYAEYHAAPGAYLFDMAHLDRYRVETRSAGLLDYTFVYGPTPKEALEDLLLSGTTVPASPPERPEATWTGLQHALARLLHGSWSGLSPQPFDETLLAGAPEELRERARQLASVINPGVRKDLAAYSFAYQQETRDRGIPPIRPLPMQFPSDAEAARHSDEFMFGDELLVAPLLSPGGHRGVYLPRGTWTRLDTNEVFPGRQTVTIQSPALVLFSRNGMIVPLQSAVMELHYFPSLGAEFFLFEDESGAYSQVHAAPAADIVRLEIESARDRGYEWVVHHTPKPRAAGFEGRELPEVSTPALLSQDKWYYDATLQNLHVRLRVAAGEDRIVNLSF